MIYDALSFFKQKPKFTITVSRADLLCFYYNATLFFTDLHPYCARFGFVLANV